MGDKAVGCCINRCTAVLTPLHGEGLVQRDKIGDSAGAQNFSGKGLRLFYVVIQNGPNDPSDRCIGLFIE